MTRNYGVPYHRILTKDEERSLLIRAKAGDQSAVDELVLCNQRFVQKIASGYMRTGMACAHVDSGDLVQWGNEGLIHAINRFDLSADVRLLTYAWYWIRAIMRRYLLRHGGQFSDGLHVLEDRAQARRKRSHLEQTLLREPTHQEVSDASGISLKTVKSALTMRPVLSLDYAEDEDDLDLLETIASDDDTFESASEIVQADVLRDAISKLPQRQQIIIAMRFGMDCGGSGMTLREVGKKLNISRERVRQIEAAAMQSLKKSLPNDFYSQEN